MLGCSKIIWIKEWNGTARLIKVVPDSVLFIGISTHFCNLPFASFLLAIWDLYLIFQWEFLRDINISLIISFACFFIHPNPDYSFTKSPKACGRVAHPIHDYIKGTHGGFVFANSQKCPQDIQSPVLPNRLGLGWRHRWSAPLGNTQAWWKFVWVDLWNKSSSSRKISLFLKWSFYIETYISSLFFLRTQSPSSSAAPVTWAQFESDMQEVCPGC